MGTNSSTIASRWLIDCEQQLNVDSISQSQCFFSFPVALFLKALFLGNNFTGSAGNRLPHSITTHQWTIFLMTSCGTSDNPSRRSCSMSGFRCVGGKTAQYCWALYDVTCKRVCSSCACGHYPCFFCTNLHTFMWDFVVFSSSLPPPPPPPSLSPSPVFPYVATKNKTVLHSAGPKKKKTNFKNKPLSTCCHCNSVESSSQNLEEEPWLSAVIVHCDLVKAYHRVKALRVRCWENANRNKIRTARFELAMVARCLYQKDKRMV